MICCARDADDDSSSHHRIWLFSVFIRSFSHKSFHYFFILFYSFFWSAIGYFLLNPSVAQVHNFDYTYSKKSRINFLPQLS